MLANGLTVAVKRLSNCYMYDKEFQREVECLLKANHTNIVRFLGYCADTQGTMADLNGKVVMADVQQRLLCFEYLPKGSLDGYIQDASGGLNWSKRYKIIKGICEGLSYLHQKKVIHLDLKPANILLDANMVAKISDFGLSRIFEEDKSRFVATKVGGTLGYLAPEFTSNEITHKFDLYSLGVILVEVLTGKRGYQAVDTVLESWSNRLDKSQGDTSFEQIRVCTEIGMECIDTNPEKRPVSIHHIVARLNETESSQVNLGSSDLLEVQPLVLRFPFEPNKSIQCSLLLTNNTDEHVPFRLINNSGNKMCFVRLPLFGIVLPRSVYTLVVTTYKQEKLPEHKYFDLILESTILGDEHNWSSETYEQDDFFEKTKKMGHMVREVTLKVVCTPQRGIITSEVLHVDIPYKDISCWDINPTKQWIIIGHKYGRIRLWSYETQKLVGSFKVSREKVSSIKFIEWKKWFVAGTKDGFIHVYSYDKLKKIKSFRANTEAKSVKTLAVHPTRTYMLSVSPKCNQAKLWDWNRGWECIQTFMTEYSTERMFVFNPMGITIASASEHTIKMWGPDSAESKYFLSGHSKKVNCLEFFTCNDHQYLITVSDDCTAKIWDIKKRTCVHTLEAFMSRVMYVYSSPNLPILITGSCNGTVHLWNSANFRVEKVFQNCCASVCRLSCLMDPQRVVIGYANAISVMCFGNVGFEPGSTDSCEHKLNADSVLGNTTSEDSNMSAPEKSMEVDYLSKVIVGPGRLPDNVHLQSPSLELVNNTDQHVAFRFKRKGGILHAKSTHTIVVGCTDGVILECSILGDRYVTFKDQSECNEFFEEAKEMGNVVHELALEGIFTRQGETPFPAIPPITKIIVGLSRNDFAELCALDVHPTDRLILTGYESGSRYSEVHLHNYDTPDMAPLHTVCGTKPYCVKFVAQKQQFVAGTSDGFIHVYNYGRDIQKIIIFKSADYFDIRLADHSTKSYVSSLSAGPIKLWGWNKGSPNLINENTDWKCTQTFEAVQYCLEWPAVFNPKDTNCFVVASDDFTIKV
nr:uncharacterized protein LOC127305396 isoform X2 [Lolium perenne]